MSEAAFAKMLEGGLPTVEGRRVRLRALVASDAPAVLSLYVDKEANRYGYQPKMDALSDAEALVERAASLAREGSILHWGVADARSDEIIGHTTLFKIEHAHGRAEIGYSVHRRLWARGIGTEAVRLLVDLAFERCGLRRLEADADPRNAGSLRLLEKLGFQREGYLRERWELGGEIQDAIVLGLLRREYLRDSG